LFRRDRMLRLMAFWIVIVPLPIAFILPIRGGGCLYVLLFGWAMIFARASCDLIAFVAKAFVAHGRSPWPKNRKLSRTAGHWQNTGLDCQDGSHLRVGSFIRTLY